jgi:2-dehydro-3-deoxygalactonokinase
MEQAAYVAVDWGTSSFRLWLVDRAGNILGKRRSHEGMMVAGKLGFATVLQSHLESRRRRTRAARYRLRHGRCPWRMG